MQNTPSDIEYLKSAITGAVELLRQGAIETYEMILELEVRGEEARIVRETFVDLGVKPEERRVWAERYFHRMQPPPGFI